MIYHNAFLFDFMERKCPIVYDSIPDKQWVSVGKAIIPDENYIYNQIIRGFKVNEKLRFKEYQFFHSRGSVQINLGRQLVYERECYAAMCRPVLPRRRDYPTTIIVIGRVPKAPEKLQVELQKDPHQKFAPSEHLVELVKEHMIQPDKEVLGLLEELKKIKREAEDERQNIADIITEQIEGLITNLAKRIFRTEKPIQISTDDRFTPEICTELIRRIGVDPYNPRPVLELLYEELVNFISVIPRERNWGKIVIEDSELKLILKEDAFTFPDLSKIDADNKWITT